MKFGENLKNVLFGLDYLKSQPLDNAINFLIKTTSFHLKVIAT